MALATAVITGNIKALSANYHNAPINVKRTSVNPIPGEETTLVPNFSATFYTDENGDISFTLAFDDAANTNYELTLPLGDTYPNTVTGDTTIADWIASSAPVPPDAGLDGRYIKLLGDNLPATPNDGEVLTYDAVNNRVDWLAGGGGWPGEATSVAIIDPSGTFPNSYLTINEAITDLSIDDIVFYIFGSFVESAEIDLSGNENYHVVFIQPNSTISNSIGSPVFRVSSADAELNVYGNGTIVNVNTAAIFVDDGKIHIFSGVILDSSGIGTTPLFVRNASSLMLDGVRLGENSTGSLQIAGTAPPSLDVRNTVFLSQSQSVAVENAIIDVPFTNCDFVAPFDSLMTLKVGNHSNTLNGVTFPAVLPAAAVIETISAGRDWTDDDNGKVFQFDATLAMNSPDGLVDGWQVALNNLTGTNTITFTADTTLNGEGGLTALNGDDFARATLYHETANVHYLGGNLA